MTKYIPHVALVIAIIALLLVLNQETGMLGSSTQADWSAANLISRGDLTVADDATINGGVLDVTTTNSATSTLIIGCIQTYASSTDTPIKFKATTTDHAIHPEYGTCP